MKPIPFRSETIPNKKLLFDLQISGGIPNYIPLRNYSEKNHIAISG